MNLLEELDKIDEHFENISDEELIKNLKSEIVDIVNDNFFDLIFVNRV